MRPRKRSLQRLRTIQVQQQVAKARRVNEQ